MGVIISSLKNDDQFISCNWWNWRPTVELIRKMNRLDDEACDLLSNGFGELSREDCTAIVNYLELQVLPDAKPEDRFLLNTEKTSEPDDGTFYRTPEEAEKNYSATVIWLQKFIDFLKNEEGVRVS